MNDKKDALTEAIAKRAAVEVDRAVKRFEKDVKIAVVAFREAVGAPKVGDMHKYPTRWQWAGFDEVSQRLLCNLCLEPPGDAPVEKKKRTWPSSCWRFVEARLTREVLEKMDIVQRLFVEADQLPDDADMETPNDPTP